MSRVVQLSNKLGLEELAQLLLANERQHEINALKLKIPPILATAPPVSDARLANKTTQFGVVRSKLDT